METGEQQGSKKARVEPPVAPPDLWTVCIDKTKLRCPICTHLLKPPIFQCMAGHLACGACHGQLAVKDRCYKQGCTHTCGYSRNLALEDVLLTTRCVRCSSSVALYEMGEHEAKCSHKPCRCWVPGCAFVGSMARFGEHLRDSHSWPARSFDYGEAFRFELPEKEPRFLLLAKEDGQVFLVLMEWVAVPVPAQRYVSLVCLRQSAADVGPPHYMCEMAAEGIAAAATGKVLPSISVEMPVPNVVLGAPMAPHKTALLVVHPMMLHGPSRELRLVVVIDKVDGQA